MEFLKFIVEYNIWNYSAMWDFLSHGRIYGRNINGWGINFVLGRFYLAFFMSAIILTGFVFIMQMLNGVKNKQEVGENKNLLLTMLWKSLLLMFVMYVIFSFPVAIYAYNHLILRTKITFIVVVVIYLITIGLFLIKNYQHKNKPMVKIRYK